MTDTTAEARAEPAAAASTPLPSPGTLLRQARERAGLGAEDLAGQLKLAKGTLEALERDDFAALSEPVYVRGYYRKIAKLLPISEAELIAAYDARQKPQRAAAASSLPRIPLAGGVAAGTSRQYRGQGIAIAVVVVIAIVLFFLFAGREPPRRIAESTPAAAPAPTAPAPAPTGTAPAPSTPAPTTAPAESTRPDASPATPMGAPVPAAAAPAPATTAAAASTVPAVPNQLVLEFSEASFLRVEDSRGRTLTVGLVHGGERRALDGQPPYTVLLGTSQNVKVYFGGQPVDFSSHVSQNGTARFTVP